MLLFLPPLLSCSDGHAAKQKPQKFLPVQECLISPCCKGFLEVVFGNSCNFQGIYCIDAEWMRWNDIQCLTRGPLYSDAHSYREGSKRRQSNWFNDKLICRQLKSYVPTIRYSLHRLHHLHTQPHLLMLHPPSRTHSFWVGPSLLWGLTKPTGFGFHNFLEKSKGEVRQKCCQSWMF